MRRMTKKLQSLSRTARSNTITYGMVIAAYVVLMILQAGGNISSSLSGMLVPICAYIVMAVSLNLTVGIMGELSLGHAGFMSVGAFSGIITAVSLQNSVSSGGLRLTAAILAGGIFAGIVSLIVVIPVLRLQGDYLAIVTLAFGEIIKNIINCLYVGRDCHGLHVSMSSAALMRMDAATGRTILQGPMGAVGVMQLSSLTAGFLLIMLTLVVVLNFVNSRAGRAVMALRDNRIAAESIGIHIAKYKMTAFVISAVLAGMAGALYAMNFSTIAAQKFDFNTSILILVFVVLGGIGNIRGSIIAAAALTILPELLRQFSDYRMLVYSIVLILVMLVTNNPANKTFFSRLRSRIAGRQGNKEVSENVL